MKEWKRGKPIVTIYLIRRRSENRERLKSLWITAAAAVLRGNFMYVIKIKTHSDDIFRRIVIIVVSLKYALCSSDDR